MKMVLFKITLATLLFLGMADGIFAAPSPSTDFYLSPSGSDANPGTHAKPFATLGKACEVSRQLPAGTPKRIIVAGGAYYNVSVTLGPEDSGLTIESAPGEKPILYGGVALNHWKKDGATFYAAPLPVGHEWQPRMLLVDGKFCPRARHPAQGTLTHLTKFTARWQSSTAGGWQRAPTSEELAKLRYNPSDIGPWLNIKNAEITVFHMWDESCVGVAANDSQKNELTLAPSCSHPIGGFGIQKYVVWNIREGLTSPGQWYFDRPANRIVYWPLPGQDMKKAGVIAPTTETILRIKGTDKEKARNVTLRGLTFSVTTVPLVAAGFGAWKFKGAISLEETENCVLTGVNIRSVAGHAVKTSGANSGVRVENSEVAYCGAGGIYVGGKQCVITNNNVHDIGLSYPSAIGIFRGGRQSIVSHNEVHHCSYSGINYGGEENLIEDNLVHHCMTVLHDGAAIYVFGAKKCVLRGNVARDLPISGGYEASAFYLDEQSEGCLVEKNLAVSVSWPSENHMAKNNLLRNNVFIVTGNGKISFRRSSAFALEHNILYATGGIKVVDASAVKSWKNNLFFSGKGTIRCLESRDPKEPEEAPQTILGDTLVGDPLFVNLEKGDLHFQPDSPALKLGIEPLDLSKAGRLP